MAKVNFVEVHEIKIFIIHIINSWNTDTEIHEGERVNINDAIIKRINEICKEKNINVCGATLTVENHRRQSMI